MSYNLITILGPTAVGKTRLGALLANRFNGEIISADSRQVYIGMDIGTGKDLGDYTVEGKTVPFHLVDVIVPGEEFNLFMFNKFFYELFDEITSRKTIPFLVGGTGLYLHSILKGYELNEINFNQERFNELERLGLPELTGLLRKLNPALHNTTDLLIKERVIRAIMITESRNEIKPAGKTQINSLVIGIKLERDEIKRRITERLKNRLQNGMIEEVKKLIEHGISYQRLDMFGLEYKFIGKHLRGDLNYNDMFQKLNSAIHDFAKRQMTWFRKMEREGIQIEWIDGPDYKAAEKIILQKYFS
ncbi:MAG: tRNA (adenosine(37)-N6)-dimethylallyltransferase MiaA [Bacteroidetes bacterium]|nr:tRNA (adenosine(37)-N6)-dimethylallyltransferase MiaA [Bacteroidota bacterium]MCL6098941.1 tRNA (adenosine(37)-N6)-dimethylallyltransferase MiaA [Bacteroidota bacterium]